jgi:hypothetical protein
MIDIFPKLFNTQWFQLAHATNPLLQLPQFGASQYFRQFRLSAQDDL